MAQGKGTRREGIAGRPGGHPHGAHDGGLMAFWRRIWQRDGEESLAACTALDVGTEFAKALVFDIDDAGHGTVRGVGRKRQGLRHMQSGTVADIAAVVDNCAVALQEAEEMAGFRPTQVVIGIAGELVKGFTTTVSQERKKPGPGRSRRASSRSSSTTSSARRCARRSGRSPGRPACPTSTCASSMRPSPAPRSMATP